MKQSKPEKITLHYKYAKNVLADKTDVMVDVKKSHRIELIDSGKTEGIGDFVTIRVFVK